MLYYYFLSSISSLGPILVGTIAIIIWYRKARVPFSAFAWGALAWVISVALKFSAAIPLNRPFLKYLATHLSETSATMIFAPYLGLLTGIFECLIPYFAIRFSRLREYDYQNAVAFGVGFGAVEAILLGIYGLLSVSGRPLNLTLVPAGTVERISCMAIHTSACVLLFHSIRKKNLAFLILSIGVKTTIDGIAGWYDITRTPSDFHNVWLIELVTGIIAILSYLILRRIHKDYLVNNGGSKLPDIVPAGALIETNDAPA